MDTPDKAPNILHKSVPFKAAGITNQAPEYGNLRVVN